MISWERNLPFQDGRRRKVGCALQRVLRCCQISRCGQPSRPGKPHTFSAYYALHSGPLELEIIFKLVSAARIFNKTKISFRFRGKAHFWNFYKQKLLDQSYTQENFSHCLKVDNCRPKSENYYQIISIPFQSLA